MIDKRIIRSHFEGDYQKFYGKYLPNVKKASGDEYQAICPFHDDRTPSFSFNGKTGEYFCHGCKKNGYVFNFYARIESLDTRRDSERSWTGLRGTSGSATGKRLRVW